MYAMTASVAPGAVHFVAPALLRSDKSAARELTGLEIESVSGGRFSSRELTFIGASAGGGAAAFRGAFTGARFGAALGSFAGPAGMAFGAFVGAAGGIAVIAIGQAYF